jgi:hypothetical protein
MELWAAIAKVRAKDVAGQTFRMDTQQDRLTHAWTAQGANGHVLAPVTQIIHDPHGKSAMGGGKFHRLGA